MPIGGYGGRRGGEGGGNLTLVHSPAISPAAERLANVPGEIRGTVILDIADISVFTAVTGGTLTIGGVTAAGIDLSGATTINDVVNTISAAVQGEAQLGAAYSVTLGYINPNFYGRIIRDDGDVPAVSGTLEPLFGLAHPGSRTPHEPASPFIVLPPNPDGGSWKHLLFRGVGQTYQSADWFFEGEFFSLDTENLSSFFALNNSNGWETNSFAGAGALQVGLIESYNVDYFDVFYDPATRTVSWQATRTLPVGGTWDPNIETLKVVGR